MTFFLLTILLPSEGKSPKSANPRPAPPLASRSTLSAFASSSTFASANIDANPYVPPVLVLLWLWREPDLHFASVGLVLSSLAVFDPWCVRDPFRSSGDRRLRDDIRSSSSLPPSPGGTEPVRGGVHSIPCIAVVV